MVDHPTDKIGITVANLLIILSAFDLCRDYAVNASGNREFAKRFEQEWDCFICQAAVPIDAAERELNDVRPLFKPHLDEATTRTFVQLQCALMWSKIRCGRSTGR